MNLVVGATGLLGGQICRLLARGKDPVRALIRPAADASRLDGLREAGVELLTGDLKIPASLEAACQGVKAVFSTASATLSLQPGDSIESVDRQGQLQLVEAAQAAGVEHFVFASFPPMAEDFALQRAKREVEKALIASRMSYTILQPAFFMEVWLSAHVGFDVAERSARIYGSGENPISWISFPNVAEFAVRSLGSPAAHNAILRLGGPEALSPLQVVRIFEEVTGGQFKVEHLLESVLRSAKNAARRPREEALAALSLAYARGLTIDMGAMLEAMPVRLVTVREFATWMVKEGAGD
jgi:uncharacterized protein YbjT (DUF2867 family)